MVAHIAGFTLRRAGKPAFGAARNDARFVSILKDLA